MTADQYILSTIKKYMVEGDIDVLTQILVVNPLEEIVKSWAGNCLNGFYLSGSRAKGTAIKLSSDMDFFISLKSDTNGTLKEIYNSLYNKMNNEKIPARKQNVSIGITYGGHKIDLVPARKHTGNTNFHSLYRSKADTWTQTNVSNHINIVKNSGRITEIVALKIWSRLHKLEFPSIYLELTVLNALANMNKNQPAKNLWAVFQYLRDHFVDKTVIDPSNSNNIISQDLYKYEKEAIANKAKESLSKQYWKDIIW